MSRYSLSLMTLATVMLIGGFFISPLQAKSSTIIVQAENDEEAMQTQPSLRNKSRKTPIQKPAEVLSSENVNRRSFFSQAGNRIVAYLERLRQRLTRTQDLSSDEKNELVEQLKQDISDLQQTALSINKTENLDELRERIDTIRNYWNEKRLLLLFYTTRLQTAHVQRTLERLNGLDVKIGILIDRLNERNIESPEIENLRGDFSSAYDAAQSSLQTARDAFEKLRAELDSPAATEALTGSYQEGRSALKEAHDHLREARHIFKQIVQSVRQQLPTISDAERIKSNKEVAE